MLFFPAFCHVKSIMCGGIIPPHPTKKKKAPTSGKTERECTPITACQPGEYISRDSTSRTDQECAPCDTSSKALDRGCTSTTNTRTTTTRTTTTRTSTTITTWTSTTETASAPPHNHFVGQTLADTAGNRLRAPAAQTMLSSIGSVRFVPCPSNFHADMCNIDEPAPIFEHRPLLRHLLLLLQTPRLPPPPPPRSLTQTP